MDSFDLIHRTIIFLIDIAGVCLCFLVYRNNSKSKVSKFFILMMISMFFWVNFAYLARALIHSQSSLTLLKISWFITPLFFLFLYFFTIHLIKEEKKHQILNKATLFLGIVITVITGLTDLVVRETELVNSNMVIIYGKGVFLFLAVGFFLMCATSYVLFKKYFIMSRREKKKIEYFLIGIFIFYLANVIFNIVLPLFFGITHLYYLGDYSIIIFLSLAAYAITKHNLITTKTLLTKVLIVITTLVFFVDIFVLSNSLTMQVVKTAILIIILYFSQALLKNVEKEHQDKEELRKAYRKINRYAKDLEKLNLKLENANRKFEDLLKMKDEFLHITSHQLRTPLTAIRGMVSMWYEGSFDNLSKRKKKEMLKNICMSAERLNNITNDMLDALELEGGIFKFQFKKMSLEKAIKETISTLKYDYNKKGLYLNFEMKNKKDLLISAEPNYARQIFSNLIDNACKYTNKGGIDISVKKSGKYAKITIKDTGIGVGKKDQKRIFQKFVRSKEAIAENVSGSGLGLFIVKKIVKAHYGKIEFYSEGKGKGSTVEVYLPIKQD